MGSLQACADQEGGSYCRSRLKIRRAPSCSKISAAFTAAAACSNSPSSSNVSFHGSCRQDMKKKGCTTSPPKVISQPLIYHTFDPEVIETAPEEFMSLVQRLTGSPQTRRLLRESSRKRKEKGSSTVQVPDMCGPDEPSQKRQETELSASQVPDTRCGPEGVGSTPVQPDPLKEGRIIVLAPTTICCTDDLPLSAPTSPNHSDISKSTTHKPQLSPLNHPVNPLAAPLLSDTKHLNPKPNHSLSSLSATSPPASYYPAVPSPSDTKQRILKSHRPPYLSSISADLPSANRLVSILAAPPSLSDTKQPNLKPNHLYLSPISANYANYANSEERICAYESPMSSNSPLSPNSSLTTSSEGYFSNREEGGASSYREIAEEEEEEEEGNTGMEEDVSISFFVYSGDSYYGNFSNADHNEVDHFLL